MSLNDIDLYKWLFLIFCALTIGMTKTGLSGINMPGVIFLALIFGGKTSSGLVLPMLIIADIFGTDTGCVSGGDTTSSCNNTSLQIQENSGNNAVAQRVLDASSSATNAANQASQLVTQYELGNPD